MAKQIPIYCYNQFKEDEEEVREQEGSNQR
jgi:hypothetical protein